MPFFAVVDAPPSPKSMKFPVFGRKWDQPPQLTIPMRFYDGICLSCPLRRFQLTTYGIPMTEGRRKTIQNGHDSGGAATWRSRQGIYSSAGTLSAACDVQRLRWAMGCENLLFV